MCKEMKRADGQIDIQKSDFMCLFSFLQYLYLYISLFLYIYIYVYIQRHIQRDYDIADAVHSPKLWRPPKNKQKNQKFP